MLLLLFVVQISGDYTTSDLGGDAFSRTLFGKYKSYKESRLQTKNYSLNTKNGVTITTFNYTMSYSDRQYRLKALVEIDIEKPIAAIQYVISTFDVYGDHVTNLGGDETADWGVGPRILTGTWESYNDFPEILTAVIYIKKIRYADGTVWRADTAELAAELGKLRLVEPAKDDKKQ